MRQMSVRKHSHHGPGSASSPGAEGDNISVNSGFSTFTEDAGLQEAYIGFVRKLPDFLVMHYVQWGGSQLIIRLWGGGQSIIRLLHMLNY